MPTDRACLTCCRYPDHLGVIDPDETEILNCPAPDNCPYPYQDTDDVLLTVEDLPW